MRPNLREHLYESLQLPPPTNDATARATSTSRIAGGGIVTAATAPRARAQPNESPRHAATVIGAIALPNASHAQSHGSKTIASQQPIATVCCRFATRSIRQVCSRRPPRLKATSNIVEPTTPSIVNTMDPTPPIGGRRRCRNRNNRSNTRQRSSSNTSSSNSRSNSRSRSHLPSTILINGTTRSRRRNRSRRQTLSTRRRRHPPSTRRADFL